jgi:hypothetical protein
MALTWLLKIKIITNVVIYLFLIISNSVLMCAYLFVALLLLNNQYELLLSRIRIALLYIFRGTVPRRGKISLRGTFYHAEVLFKSKGRLIYNGGAGSRRFHKSSSPIYVYFITARSRAAELLAHENKTRTKILPLSL